MATFHIKSGVLLKMFQETQAEGKTTKGENKPMLEDCFLDVKKTSLTIEAIDENEVLLVLSKTEVEKKTVKKVGKIPILLAKSIDSLKRFKADDIVYVDYLEESNIIQYLRKKPKLDVLTPTIAPDAVKSVVESHSFKFNAKENVWKAGKELETDVYMKIPAEEFAEIIKDGEQIEYRSFPFRIENNVVEVTVADEESGAAITREVNAKSVDSEETIESIYSYGFGNAFNNLSGELEIWLINGGPMFVKKENGKSKLIYILASTELQDEEDDDEDDNTDNVDRGEIDEKLQESLDEDDDYTEE